eukprot:2539500-Pyramimonas_sp.AAC.1
MAANSAAATAACGRGGGRVTRACGAQRGRSPAPRNHKPLIHNGVVRREAIGLPVSPRDPKPQIVGLPAPRPETPSRETLHHMTLVARTRPA